MTEIQAGQRSDQPDAPIKYGEPVSIPASPMRFRPDTRPEAAQGVDDPVAPHETEAARIGRTEHGAYIVAPDSADPWPSEIWERVDLEVVEMNLAVLAQDEADMSSRARRNEDGDEDSILARSGFVFSEEERELLGSIDADSLRTLEASADAV